MIGRIRVKFSRELCVRYRITCFPEILYELARHPPQPVAARS
jgi:hypothetical protein